MKLFRRTYTGKAMGTEVNLMIVTDDARAGDEALRRAAGDIEDTEQALSRFREDSNLSVLNREGRLRLDALNREGHLLAGWRLMVAVKAAADAYEWSEGLLDPRVIGSLEAFGYGKSLPLEEVRSVTPAVALEPVDMGAWGDQANGAITLPKGVRLDLAAKLLIIGGERMTGRLDGRFQAIFTDRHGRTRSSFDRQPIEEVR